MVQRSIRAAIERALPCNAQRPDSSMRRHNRAPSRYTCAIEADNSMAVLNILKFPDPRLRTRAAPVAVVDAAIDKLVGDLFETMYQAPGIGLAASQVNVHKRVIVIDVSKTQDDPLVLINPQLALSGEMVETDEGCLSVPGFYEPVTRRAHVRVEALDRQGKSFSMEADGLLAVCIQHECDHLEGKLFVDYLSNLKRTRIQKRVLKPQRNGA